MQTTDFSLESMAEKRYRLIIIDYVMYKTATPRLPSRCDPYRWERSSDRPVADEGKKRISVSVRCQNCVVSHYSNWNQTEICKVYKLRKKGKYDDDS